MTQDPIQQITNLKRSIEAMKSAGQSDSLIVDRISKRTDIPEQIKTIFSQAKISGLTNKAVSDFLQIPLDTTFKAPPLRSVAEMPGLAGTIGKVGEFVGVEPLGRTIAGRLSGLTQEQTGVSKRELYGSIAQTAGSLALPFAGKLLAGGTLGQRIVTSGLTQAGFGAAASAASGGTNEQISNAAIFGGLLGSAIPLGGLIVNGLKNVIKKYPVTAYTKIFRNTVDDVAKNMQSKAAGRVVNPTLGEEMLNSGRTLGQQISGSADEMGTALAGLKDEIGKQLDPIATASKARIPLGNKKTLMEVLKTIRGGFDEGINPEKVKETQKLISILKKSKLNTVSAKQALDLKQFIDTARTSPSFLMNKNLSPKQDAFKRTADLLRRNLHELVPELRVKLNAYRIATNGFADAVKEAVREGNSALINRLEAIAVGAGVAVGQPAVAALASGAIRASRSPYLLTKSAQAVRKLTEAVTNPRTLGSINKNVQQASSVLGRRTLSEIGKF